MRAILALPWRLAVLRYWQWRVARDARKNGG
jgi:hypothetical protein